MQETQGEGGGGLILDVFLFFRKALYDVKAIGLQINFNIF